MVIQISVLFFAVLCSQLTVAANIYVVGMDNASSSKLGSLAGKHVTAIKAAGKRASVRLSPTKGDLIVLHCSNELVLSPGDREKLGHHVAEGGSLLISLDRTAGKTPFQLAFMLPSTAWNTTLTVKGNTSPYGPLVAGSTHGLFNGIDCSGLRLRFHYLLSPVHAWERGIQRYERYGLTERYMRAVLDRSAKRGPNHTLWTRPLINRNWQVPLRAQGIMKTAMVVTGEYGTGRVAILAGSLDDFLASQAGVAIVRQLLAFLEDRAITAPPAVIEKAKGSKIDLIYSRSGSQPPVILEACSDRTSRKLYLTITNTSSEERSGELIVRLSSWQKSFLQDFRAWVNVPARSSRTAVFTIPPVTQFAYDELKAMDAYEFRAGLLSRDRSHLLVEARGKFSFVPPLSVTLKTPSLYNTPWPYSEKKFGAGDFFWPNRMGFDVGMYACKPNSKQTGRILVRNGLHNIASIAKINEKNIPGNPALVALTDSGANFNARIAEGNGVEGYGDWVSTEANSLIFTFQRVHTICAVDLIGNSPEQTIHNPAAARITIDGKEVYRETFRDQFDKGLGTARCEFSPTPGRIVQIDITPGRAPIHLAEV
ncbi:MAG: hypothetical protein D6820_18625, partial [Lentisphaerae bacterium]